MGELHEKIMVPLREQSRIEAALNDPLADKEELIETWIFKSALSLGLIIGPLIQTGYLISFYIPKGVEEHSDKEFSELNEQILITLNKFPKIQKRYAVFIDEVDRLHKCSCQEILASFRDFIDLYLKPITI